MPALDDLTIISQTGRLLAVETPLPFDVLMVDSFIGSERVSAPFNFQLQLVADHVFQLDRKVNPDDLIGQPMTIRVITATGEPRFFNGIVSRFTRGHKDGRFVYYRAELVPWFSLLTLTSDCRFYQKKTVPEIVSELLEERGFKGRFRFEASQERQYTRWDYCAQYRESDFNFISRMLEQEGIFYYFEHQENQHILVMADSLTNYHDLPLQKTDIRFSTEIGIGAREDTITAWEPSEQILSGQWILRDHHFEMPKNPLEANEPAVFKVGGTENLHIYDFPGEYAQRFNEPGERLDKVRAEGDLVARLRMEEDELGHLVVSGSSHCRTFSPGYKIKVLSQPGDDIGGAFWLTSVQHSAVQLPGYASDHVVPAPYTNTFSAIPADVQYRPARRTPKPVIQGPQTARVVDETVDPDPPKEEIWPDKYGRVRVRFPWDRHGKYSCWVRVAQPWAGRGWGHQWVPRVGDDVVVEFLEGDPDCPIIVGSVYNFDNPPLFPLPENKTQSGIKTRSSPGGNAQNFNMIRFEDKKGHEFLEIHAERTMTETVEASQSVSVGGGQSITVGGNRTIRTGGETKGVKHGDTKELVFGNHNLHVLSDFREMVDGKASTSVMNDDVHYCGGDYSLSAAKGVLVTADGITLTANKITLVAGASSIVLEAGGITVLGPIIKLNPAGYPPPVAPLAPLNTATDDP